MSCAGVEEFECQQRSVVPNLVTWIYLGLSSVFMLGVSISAAVNHSDITWRSLKKTPLKCLEIWFQLVWEKKSCYLPGIAHIFDQVSDVGVILVFYFLSHAETKYERNCDIDYCGGVNTSYLFYGSIFFFFAYRIISASIILRDTANWSMFGIQLLDFLLYKCIYISYRFESKKKSNPQRLIQSLEAVMLCFGLSKVKPFVCFLVKACNF